MTKQTDKKKDKTIGRLDRKVKRLNTGLTSVYETTKLLTSPMELKQVLEIVVKTVTESLDLDAAGLRLLDPDTGELALMATYGLSDVYKNKGPVTASESELNMRALSGEPIIVPDMQTNPNFKRYHNEILREGIVSSLSIGLIYRNKGVGILRLYSFSKRQFPKSDISLAKTIASQSAVAIVNARLYRDALVGERMARQLKIAGDVQRHLIPKKSPDIAGLDLAGMYVPCFDVGGDFYDFIPLSDGRLAIVIGDVMGKGVPASLTMASVRSALRAYAEVIDSLESLISRTNALFCHDNELGVFATLFCAIYNPTTGSLSYCNCGHEPSMLVRSGKIIKLFDGGPILGLGRNSEYEIHELNMQKNDMLVMYTDGLTDALNFKRQSFGVKRLRQAILDSAAMNAAQSARNILWTMRKFTGLTKRFDDTALVVLKKTE